MMASPFCHVLVGWDGSAAAAEALSTAVAIASPHGHVVALSVVRRPPRDAADDGPAGGPGGIRHRAEEIFERLRRDGTCAEDLRMSTQVIAGDESRAGAAVCAYAAEHGFDLLVLGRHGEGGLLPARLGRVAKTAAQSSTVPVLLLDAR
jgi:nucleotide-binding universal stress UspA family protein